MRRRTLLSTLGLAGLAGCLRLDQADGTTTEATIGTTTTDSQTIAGTATTDDDATTDDSTTADEQAPAAAESVSLDPVWRLQTGTLLEAETHADAFYAISGGRAESRTIEGADRWRLTNLPDDRHPMAVTVDRNTVALGLDRHDESMGARTLVIDDATGAARYVYDAPDDDKHYRTGALAITGDLVLVATQADGGGSDQRPRVTALDLATGDARWHVDIDDGFVTGLLPYHDHLYVTVTDQVLDLDLATGDRNRTHDVFWGFATPTIVDDTVYGGAHTLEARTLPDFEIQWGYEPIASVSGPTSPVVTDDSVVVGTDAGHVLSLDRATGDERWQTRTNGVVTTIDTAGGLHWVLDQAGYAYAYDPREGNALFAAQPAGSDDHETLAVIDDTLLLGSQAFQVRRTENS